MAPVETAKAVKYHPLPNTPRRGWRAATPAAAKAQREIEAAAAAVLGL